ncbi:MAG: hypothetical protein LQ350_008608 [Teloschistes chrysophthalmus]|nr:MAG: hypothetical protein LQ350_008608 [Niorma chrysophthalma]
MTTTPTSGPLRGLVRSAFSIHRIRRPLKVHLQCQRHPNSTPSTIPIQNVRPFSSLPRRSGSSPSNPPLTVDRGPASQEDTQTDFSVMDVLGNTPPPTTAIDACLSDGFHLDNGLKIGDGSGCLLVGGEAFAWRPWEAASPPNQRPKTGKMVNAKGQWEVDAVAWGVLEVVWPKPDLLILGLGPTTMPISPETRRYINGLGIRVDVQDTRNAAAQFNLLATERGTEAVAAALVPMGWREPRR